MRVYYTAPANRSKKGIGVAAITAATILCVVLVITVGAGSTELDEEIYIVERGDSLWSISAEFCPDSMNRQDWIAMVRERNGITGSLIRPGQRIVVFTAN